VWSSLSVDVFSMSVPNVMLQLVHLTNCGHVSALSVLATSLSTAEFDN